MKKILTRQLSVLLSFLVAVTSVLLPVTVFADETGTYGELTYSVVLDYKVQIDSCNKSAAGKIEIPSYIDDLPVTDVAQNAFSDCTGITSIVVSKNIQSLKQNPFINCSSLESIIVDPLNAVYHCSGNCLIETATKTLVSGCKNSVIPSDGSVTEIGAYSFSGTGITSITVPECITKINDRAFKDCKALTEINFNAENVTLSSDVVGHFSAAGIDGEGITLTFGDSVETIPDFFINPWYAFSNNVSPNIKTVIIGKNVTTIGKYAFKECGSIEDVIMPESLTNIGYRAFYGCSSLKEITIPENVTQIGAESFVGCTLLQTLNYNAKDAQIEISNSQSSPTYGSASEWLDNHPFDLIIGSSVETIRDYTFRSLNNMRSVTIGSTVKTINTDSFYRCFDIETIYFNGTLKEWNERFKSCFLQYSNNIVYLPYADEPFTYNLNEDDTITITDCDKECAGNVVVPSVVEGFPVTRIGENAFANCSEITSIVIPESISNISAGSFNNCTALQSIVVDPANTFYRSDGNCVIETESKTLVFGCKNSVIPSNGSVTAIGSFAFCGCEGITTLIVPEKITSIGKYAFKDCTGITDVFFNAELCSAFDREQHWLDGCEQLNKVVFGKSVKVIPENVFYNCKVSEITMHNTVNTVGKNAFYNCPVAKVYFKGTPEEWAENYNTSFTSFAYVHTIYYQGGVCRKTDGISHVGVEFEYSTFGTPNDSELKLVVEKIAQNDQRYSAFKALIDGYQVALYAIHMSNEADNTVMQPVDNMKVTVRIPLTAGVTPEIYNSVFIHHRKADGTTERIKYSTGDLKIENGYFVFTVDSFSDFSVCSDDCVKHIDTNADNICDICGEKFLQTKISVASPITIKTGTKLTIKATAVNLAPSYSLVLCIDGKEIKGDNKEVVYEYGELTGDINYYVKIVNARGAIQKDENGADLIKDGGKITCSAGFFEKLIAFFLRLFRALPQKTVEP